MRSVLKVLPIFGVLAALIPAVGCGSGNAAEQKTPPLFKLKVAQKRAGSGSAFEQDAIQKLLDTDREQFKTVFGQLTPTTKPTAFTQMVNDYLIYLNKVDVRSCPDEFRTIHDKHLKAWKEFHAAIRHLPDAYEGSDFMDSIYALFAGNEGRGRTLGGNVVQAAKKVTGTYSEMHTSAAMFGMEVFEE